MEFERVWNQLSATPLVDQVSAQDFTRLFESVQIRRLGRGEVLVEAGPKPERLFILVKGVIEARAEDKNEHLIALRSFGAGDILGDTVVFQHQPWVAQYRANEDSVLLELDRKGLERLLSGHGDPRRLLDVLRSQDNDSTVRRAVRHLAR